MRCKGMAPKVWIKFSYKITIQVTGKHNFIILKSNMLFLDFFPFWYCKWKFKDASRKKLRISVQVMP